MWPKWSAGVALRKEKVGFDASTVTGINCGTDGCAKRSAHLVDAERHDIQRTHINTTAPTRPTSSSILFSKFEWQCFGLRRDEGRSFVDIPASGRRSRHSGTSMLSSTRPRLALALLQNRWIVPEQKRAPSPEAKRCQPLLMATDASRYRLAEPF